MWAGRLRLRGADIPAAPTASRVRRAKLLAMPSKTVVSA
jgi:hypothetical protein